MYAVVDAFLSLSHGLGDLRRRSFSLQMLAFAALTSACSDPGESSMQTNQGIRNGDPRDDPWAVQIFGDDATCSGVLITPAHVMTAAHCVVSWEETEELDDEEDLTITTGANSEIALGEYTRGLLGPGHKMRKWGSGDMPNFWGGDTTGNWSADRTDIAIVPLDALVPPSLATPRDPPQGNVASEFDAFWYGYDGGTLQERGRGDVDKEDRVWNRVFGEIEVCLLTNPLSLAQAATLMIDGINALTGQALEKGDSGGPLLPAESGGTVAGVWSSYWPEFGCEGQLDLLCPIECGIDVEAHWPDASRADARSWWRPILTDSEGRLKGTCDLGPEALRTIDSDGDTIPDGCDPCPQTKDLDYDLTRTPDTDEDGIPDRCDNCRTVADSLPGGNQAQPDADGDGVGDFCDFCANDDEENNCNLEAELTNFYEGLFLTEPPVVFFDATRNPFGESHPAAVARYRDAFKVGACENAPCPEFSVADARLPASRRNPDPNADCRLHASGDGFGTLFGACEGGAKTDITHRPDPSPTTAGRVGSVHMKWCECRSDDIFRHTLDGRAECQDQFDCLGTPSRFSQADLWLDLRTAPFNGTSETGAFENQEAGSYALLAGTTPRRRLWDFLSLPPERFVTDMFNRMDALGVLWNNVRDVNGFDTAARELVRRRGSSFHDGDTGRAFIPNGTVISLPPLDNVCVTQPTICDLGIPCPMCLTGRGGVIDRWLLRPPQLGDITILPTVIGPDGPTNILDPFTAAARAALDPTSTATTISVPRGEPDLRGSLASQGSLTEKIGVILGPPTDTDPSGVVVRSVIFRKDGSSPIDVAPLTATNRPALFAGLRALPTASLFPMRPKCGEVRVQATRGLLPGVSLDGTINVTRSRYAVPEDITVVAGNAGNALATLRIVDRVTNSEETCTYRGQASVARPTVRRDRRAGMTYLLQSCNRGSVAGGLILADGFMLHLDGSDGSRPLTVATTSIYEQQPCRAVPLPVPDPDPDPRITTTAASVCESVELHAFAGHDVDGDLHQRRLRPGERIESGPPEEVGQFSGQQRLPKPRRFAVPAEISVTSGNARGAIGLLSFQNGEQGPLVTCEYRADEPGHHHGRGGRNGRTQSGMRLRSCSTPFESGDVFQADRLTLDLTPSDRSHGPTVVRVTLAESSPCGVTAGPEAVLDEQGVVFSSSRGEVFLFGGIRNDRANPTAWIHSLFRDEWIEIGLGVTARPGDVLAATYRIEDSRVYAVDRLNGEERLITWDGRSDHFDELGEWPRAWHQARFERKWLVAGVAGDLFYVGSKRRLTVFVRLGFRADGKLSVLGVKEIDKPVFGRPIAAEDAIAFTTMVERNGAEEPIQESARFDSFRRVPRHRFRGNHGEWEPRLTHP